MTPIPTHRAVALGAFRTSVFFIFAIIAFAERSDHTRGLLLTAIFLLDVATWHLCTILLVAADGVYNRTWMDTLADRLFIERVLENVRSGIHFDPAELRKQTIVASKDDVAKYLTDETIWFQWGGFKKTLLGVGHFAWYWLSYLIFYAIAGAIGNAIRV